MTEKCDTENEIKRRSFHGLSTLSSEIRHLTRGILGKQGLTQVAIKNRWNEILGPELAFGIKPVTLTFPFKDRMGGTLKVRTAGGAFALLFEHQKGQIIEKINTYFGYPAVNNIKIEQGGVKLDPQKQAEPVWPLNEEQLQKLSEKVANIQDDELRKKMLDIGVQLLQKTGPK